MPPFFQGPLFGIFLLLFSLFTFDESIGQDIKDGTFAWLVTQNRGGPIYLWAKITSFCIPLLLITLFLAPWYGLLSAFSLFLIVLQGTFWVAHLSFVRHAQCIPLGEASMSLFILPLCIPSFLLVGELWQQETPWWNGLYILLGLTLFSFVLGTLAFERTKSA